MQRTTLMIVQRLTRASEPWNEGLIPSVSQLLRLVKDRMFIDQPPAPTSSELARDESRLPIVQEQLLYFVIEIMASVRKVEFGAWLLVMRSVSLFLIVCSIVIRCLFLLSLCAVCCSLRLVWCVCV